jgi:hypothetical protein
MNFFKIEQGGFFGIMIPGALLYINVTYTISLFTNNISFLNNQSGFSVEMGLVGFVFSIVLGFVLRMFPYECSDWFRTLKFPYFNYYFNQKWNMFPKCFRDFYDKYVELNYSNLKKLDEISNKLAGANDELAKFIVNNLKVKIFKESIDLKNEILYLEGVSRLIIGTLYALVLSVMLITSLLVLKWEHSSENIFDLILIACYIILIIIIYIRLPTLRGKEVRTILEAFTQIE